MPPAQQLNFNKVTFLVLTGGSRGIGATIAIETGKKLAKGSVILLTARSSAGLEATKAKILASNPDVSVLIHTIDLSHLNETQVRTLLKDSLPAHFEQAVIFHNVGSTGDVSKQARDANNVTEWRENFDVNVFSVVLLNNVFLELTKSASKKYVINITSKAAIVPMESFAFYCPNKAAREMFFRVLAEEEKDDESLVILNYAPGPVDTDMLANVATETLSAGFRDFIADGKKTGAVLTTEQTTAKLIEILEKGEYKNGDHVDYFDV